MSNGGKIDSANKTYASIGVDTGGSNVNDFTEWDPDAGFNAQTVHPDGVSAGVGGCAAGGCGTSDICSQQ